ncbi:interstitial collagenase-like [Temnothorax americanus]|uniref:interstitial collagenase-like n=1 Tax=Temnothorax americanus TaxID=1964332 RepID=UPI0040697426
MRLARVIALTACFIAAGCINFTITDENYALTFDYLQKYGYLSKDVDAVPAQKRYDVLRKAFEDLQNYYDLPSDGTPNNETLQFMRKLRCGFRDILKHRTKASLSKWPKTHLTWHFHLADGTELNTARAAFDLWSQHSALTFERSETPNADIIISWRRLRHYITNTKINGAICSDRFDGPGNVLAFLPTDQAGFVSEVHVDGDEPWHIYVNKHPADKFFLHYTLTHEIGHSLGLVHNGRKTSVMFAKQPDQQYPVKLDQNDIADIQRLYVEEIVNDPPRRTPPPPPPPPSPDLCSLDRVNGILILENRMYISYKRYVWSIDLDGRTYNGPLALSNHMSFLHDNYTRVTAAYQSPSGDLVVLVDNLVYLVQYPEFSLWPGWPKTLQELGFPENTLINGAVNTHKGRSFVVFNGNSVGEIDKCHESKKVAKFTPLEVTFPGIPTGVTSIFRYIDGNLYFTTRTQFYKFNEFTRTVLSAGKFDLRMLNIVCSKAELLQQLRDLLDRIVRLNDNSLTSTASDYWNDDDTGVRLSDLRIRRKK